MSADVGRIGIWTLSSGPLDLGAAASAAAEAQELGFHAIWLGGRHFDKLAAASTLLDASQEITVATGILNIWLDAPAAEVASRSAAMREAHPGRLLVGIGPGHRERVGAAYQRPYTALTRFLDELDEADTPLGAGDRVLGVQRPKSLALARERSAGALTFMATPRHTRAAREVLGAHALLAPVQMVVLDTDPVAARALARRWVANSLQTVNYRASMMYQGFTEGEVADGGSDAVVDALVAWGDAETIARRIDEHRVAGADHVCIWVLSDDDRVFALEQWRALAPSLMSRA